jgi:hypothetical protein
MDELIFDDKRYISSKQAAKVTGYAKDYVGQLCREGRVPARLVGRSWYVLESGIKDHRFGKEAEIDNKAAPKSTIGAMWASPRYESVSNEPLPVVSRPSVVEQAVSIEEPVEAEEPALVIEELVPAVEALTEEREAESVREEVPVMLSVRDIDVAPQPAKRRRNPRGRRLLMGSVSLFFSLLGTAF